MIRSLPENELAIKLITPVNFVKQAKQSYIKGYRLVVYKLLANNKRAKQSPERQKNGRFVFLSTRISCFLSAVYMHIGLLDSSFLLLLPLLPFRYTSIRSVG